jgi:hypothetical protein
MKGMAAVFVSVLLMVLAMPYVFAQTEKDVCVVYFTYVGCPHCAVSDPFVLVEAVGKYPSLLVIEYEFVLEPENSYLIYDYNDVYQCGAGVPLVVFDKGRDVSGDTPILGNMGEMIESGPNDCPLLDVSVAFEDLDITSLPGKPKIWTNDRILIKSGAGGDNALLKELLTAENLSHALEGVEFEITEPEEILLSGIRFPQLGARGSAQFEHAIRIGNWAFQWNGEGFQVSGNGEDNGNGDVNEADHNNDTNDNQLSGYVYPIAILSFIILMLLLIYFARMR